MSSTEEDIVYNIARRLPKVQLHLHLDGSLSESFISDRASARGIDLPCAPADLREHLIDSKQKAQQIGKYSQPVGGNWDVFTFCNRFLQTASELQSATCQLVTCLLLEHNCQVIEIRFCPSLHTLEGHLDDNDAVAAVVKGFSEAPPVRGGIILCALRSHDKTHAARIAELAVKWKDRGVIGVDMAGDERAFPAVEEIEALTNGAKSANVPITIHAGEMGNKKAGNIEHALQVGASRLGHAIELGRNRKLSERVFEQEVYVETCIIANCTSDDKVPANSFQDHPIREMLNNGVKVAGFNCDNLLLSGTMINRPNPTLEIVKAKLGCGLSWSQIRGVLINGTHATFDKGSRQDSHPEFVRKFTEEIDSVLCEVLEKQN